MNEEKKNIVIKIGSALLFRKGKFDKEFVVNLAKQVKTLMSKGYNVLIVSSGAVARDSKTHRSKNLRAITGQLCLMFEYKTIFALFGIEIGQLLLTDQDFHNPIIKNTIEEAWEEGVVVIVNANDGISNKELKNLDRCADNDVLTSEIVLYFDLEFDAVIFGFKEKGIIGPDGSIVATVKNSDLDKVVSCMSGGSYLGHGENGGQTKVQVCCLLASEGVTAVIVEGSGDFVINGLERIQGENNGGTLFIE